MTGPKSVPPPARVNTFASSAVLKGWSHFKVVPPLNEIITNYTYYGFLWFLLTKSIKHFAPNFTFFQGAPDIEPDSSRHITITHGSV
jgi:hypothetical protein